MGRVLGGNAEFTKTPVVKLTQKAGTKFKGTLKASKDSKFGKIYTFTILDGDAPITLKQDDGSVVDVDVKPGDDVAVFASGQLNDKLSGANIGENVEITFLDKKLNPKTGRYYNDYHAEVVD